MGLLMICMLYDRITIYQPFGGRGGNGTKGGLRIHRSTLSDTKLALSLTTELEVHRLAERTDRFIADKSLHSELGILLPCVSTQAVE